MQYVRDTLITISGKIENKGALSLAEQTFLQTNPLAVLPILKTAVTVDVKDAVVAGLADITANAYTLQILSDLYLQAEVIARKAKEMNSIMTYLEHMQKIEAQMTAEITRRYGKDVAARLQM